MPAFTEQSAHALIARCEAANPSDRIVRVLHACARRANKLPRQTASGILSTGTLSRGSCAFYWDAPREVDGVRVTEAEYEDAVSLQRAYCAALRFVREELPRWEDVRRISYADNSVELEQRSARTGEVRRVLLSAPHGDPC